MIQSMVDAEAGPILGSRSDLWQTVVFRYLHRSGMCTWLAKPLATALEGPIAGMLDCGLLRHEEPARVCRGTACPRLPKDQVEQAFGVLPSSLRAQLLPFQRAGVRYGLAHQGRILLADEMGVGKTVQALALSACYQVCSSHSRLSGR